MIFDPQDDFGGLEQRYRCLSCHGIRGSGDPQACDITLEGSKVNRAVAVRFSQEALLDAADDYHRHALFNFPDDQARFMSEYMSAGLRGPADRRGRGRRARRRPTRAGERPCSTPRGASPAIRSTARAATSAPASPRKSPSFPREPGSATSCGRMGLSVGQGPAVAGARHLGAQPGLSDQEALDLTKYVMSLKNPAAPKKDPDVPKK